jgi:tetratricopeptide (TPR) repeat protein
MTLEEADRTFGGRKYAEALELYKQVAERAAGASEKVEALAQVARCCSLTQRMEEGRQWLAKATAIASPEDPPGWSRLLGVRGIFERESGEKAKAKATFIEMYDYCVARKLPKRAVDAVHHVAIVAPLEEQPSWALKGIAQAETLKDDGWLAVLWNNLGTTYEDLKQFDRALEAYHTAREYHGRSGDAHRILVADWAIAHATRLAGRPGDARTQLEALFERARARHAEHPTPDTLEWVGWCLKDLGEAVAALGDRAKGLGYLREGRTMLVEAGIGTWWPEGLKKLDEAVAALEAG